MNQEATEGTGYESRGSSERAQANDSCQLVRALRQAAKRRKRLIAWMNPMMFLGIPLTLLIGLESDTRLSIAIFCSTATAILSSFFSGYFELNRLAEQAARLCDIRVIGPLLTILHSEDDGASSTVEAALIALLPAVQRTTQLSREARKALARLLLREETGVSRTGPRYNVELIRVALQTVGRTQDSYALPAVRRLAAGQGPVQPAAQIRDLAQDILPILAQKLKISKGRLKRIPQIKNLLEECNKRIYTARKQQEQEELTGKLQVAIQELEARLWCSSMIRRGTQAMFIRQFALAIALLAGSGGAALAQEQPQEKCPGELENVQREVAQASISRPKETQIKALLEQVARACREHNEVVALAGIDQVRAILQAERKSG